MSTISLIVVDDHGLFRQGLVEMLSTVDDFEVEGQGASTDDALALATRLRPDVAILDVGMPGPGLVETIGHIAEASPKTKVVIVTMFDEPRTIYELISAGAAAYLLKSSDRVELATAVRSAARLDDAVLISVTRQALLGLGQVSAALAKTALSPRESQILHLLAEAQSNQDISTTLHISPATVKRHLSNIYAKLDVRSRAQALRVARRLGVIDD